VEDYWERGEGARLVEDAPRGTRKHNLAIWGWDIRDALSRSVEKLQTTLAAAPGRTKDDAFQQIPSAAGERSALLTLSGGEPGDTPVSLARRFGDEGVDGRPGIETLVVALGANNILGTILNFHVAWTQEGDEPGHPAYRDLDQKGHFNAWMPSHFAAEFDDLVAAVRDINAHHVIVFTVPHVTIAPMVRGVGDKMPGDRYFARYTRPWIRDDAFNANRDPCLSGDVLRVLDFAVDQYNDHIVRRVEEARVEGLDWRVLDNAGILDRLAYRRYMVDEQAQPPWWTPYVLPEAYRTLSPQPDTRFYRSDRFGRLSGGLFALDGVHPTTIGYGIIAREVMHVMTAAGVNMARAEPDFEALIEEDTLIDDPPARIASILDLVEWANKLVDLYRAIGGQPPI
jgi:hypothetical protein